MAVIGIEEVREPQFTTTSRILIVRSPFERPESLEKPDKSRTVHLATISVDEENACVTITDDLL